MRVMAIIEATEESEREEISDPTFYTEMDAYDREWRKAGIMTGGDGLGVSHFGERVSLSLEKVKVTNGPFAETKELVAGSWIWEVGGTGEALEWARSSPTPEGRRCSWTYRRRREVYD